MDSLSMSLDDIIKRNKNFRGNLRGRGRRNNAVGNNFQNRNNVRGRIRKRFSGRSQNRFTSYKSRRDIDGMWKHDLYDGEENEIMDDEVNDYPSDSNVTKLMISNLEFGVSDYDLTELFGDFGTLLSAEIHYDRSGRSLGTGEVIFKNKASAVEAMNYYNGVPLDGRPMSIRFSSESVQPTTFRSNRGRSRQMSINRRRKNVPVSRGFKRNSSSRGRTNVGNRNRSVNKRSNNLTAEQLDAELDSYVNAN